MLAATHSPAPRAPPPAASAPPRSFQGFTCLLQVSTRAADWLVDALALRRAIGPALASLMADPGVVKVLHGADRDVLWLQVWLWRGDKSGP